MSENNMETPQDSKKKKSGKLKYFLIGGGVLFGLIATMMSGGDNVDIDDKGKGTAKVANTAKHVDDSMQNIDDKNVPPEIKKRIIEEEKKRAEEAAKSGKTYIPRVVSGSEVNQFDEEKLKRLELEVEKLKVRNENLTRELYEARTRASMLETRLRRARSRGGSGKQPEISYMKIGNTEFMTSEYSKQIDKSVGVIIKSVGSSVIEPAEIEQVSLAGIVNRSGGSSVGQTGASGAYSPGRARPSGTKTTLADNSDCKDCNNSSSSQNGDKQMTGKDILRMAGIRAGDIRYGTLLTDANSDVPGPVFAQVEAGALRGYRLAGQFRLKNGYMTLNFNRLISTDGQSWKVNAIAVDPYTMRYNVEDERDRHILMKMAAIFGAAWLQGLGEAAMKNIELKAAIAQQAAGNNPGSASANALDTQDIMLGSLARIGNMLASIIEPYAKRPDTVVKYANSDIGIMFLE